MEVVATLAPISCDNAEQANLPPIKDVLGDIPIVSSQIDKLRKELTRNKTELQASIAKMKALIENFDYESIVAIQKECQVIREFTNKIRMRMIKHDCIDIQNNSDIYINEIIPPTWFEFKREGPKYCVHCECVETIEWRNGPWGKATLCNACGLWYRKLKKKFTAEQSAIIMEEKRLFSNKHDRKEFSKFDADDKRLKIIKDSLIDRINKFIKEVELCKSTAAKLKQIKAKEDMDQKVTPREINKYDSISRIC
ncbi:GATA-type transcription factor [Kluyveromyces lactis]|uniref:KLLA0F09757p n=1 Tax=Kluyveromyces lactis (strain ATCC 8585 / CBS 2359 / DSM 70799 / NBRC 1267 / NRRL Y-1140 / WM37) TaxID=284590 RepID=Q6CKL6_KLULA|nr:uncharacterized protein KLLA0_F09757g [Kluyveromyces lactis]CAG98231.1 KLLA0F09757p [Kluyveromyces lactis]|eukprot:XP_455523.1 uncharacterized protein KLLA0_F09757g [Kluyveromyces lactis]